MNLQDGEGNNNQSPVANAAAVVDRPLNATVEPNAGASSNPLSQLENTVADAAREAAQTTVPVQASAETPQGQFKDQFDSEPATPPVAESAVPGLIDAALANLGTPPSGENSTNVPVAPLDPSIKTVGDLLEKGGPQVVESNSEVKLPPKVQEFLDSVLNAAHKYEASEEETKEEVVV